MSGSDGKNFSSRNSNSTTQSFQSSSTTRYFSGNSQGHHYNKAGNKNILKGSPCDESTNIISSSSVLGESRLPSGVKSSQPAVALGTKEQGVGFPAQTSRQLSTAGCHPWPPLRLLLRSPWIWAVTSELSCCCLWCGLVLNSPLALAVRSLVV